MKIVRHRNSSNGPTLAGPIAQGVEETLATTKYTPENLLRHIAIKLNQAVPIQERDKTFIGRLLNRFNGEDPNVLTIDGMVLVQLFEILDMTANFEIIPKHQYDVNPNDLIELYDRAKVNIPYEDGTNYPASVKRK